MKNVILVFCFALLASSNAFSKDGHKKFETIVKKYELQSLVKSGWMKKNPLQLPFEECRIDTYYGTFSTQHNFWHYGQYVQTLDPGSYLSCFSRKHKIGYRLPIKIGAMDNVGLYLDIAAISLLNLSITVNNLEGKQLEDLFKGSYKGIAFHLDLLFGMSAYSLKNEVGIKIRNVSFEEGVGIALGKANLILSHREDFYLKEMSNEFVIMNIQQLVNYKFVKVD